MSKIYKRGQDGDSKNNKSTEIIKKNINIVYIIHILLYINKNIGLNQVVPVFSNSVYMLAVFTAFVSCLYILEERFYNVT